jgi:hypothetical protein
VSGPAPIVPRSLVPIAARIDANRACVSGAAAVEGKLQCWRRALARRSGAVAGDALLGYRQLRPRLRIVETKRD